MARHLFAFVFLGATAGCSFAVRSPDMYRDDTGKVLATRSSALKGCYDDVLKATPTAAGTVTVDFTVEEDTGKIKEAHVDPAKSTAPEPLRQCVLKSLEGLALFPGDKRTGKASWSWDFSPAKS